LLSLAPAAALATAAASPARAAPPRQENWKLLRLGEQLAGIEAGFAAAISRKAEARAAADRQWPQPPAAITFEPGVRPPVWCGVQCERDIDDNIFYHHGNRNTARKIADPWQLQTLINLAARKGTTKTDRANAKLAKQLLAIARRYEAAREGVIESTGYRQAVTDLDDLTRRIDRVARLIYNCEAQTYSGLAIKARALIVATAADPRPRMLYAEQLAGELVSISRIAA
jgi:hypothetical protein